MEGQHENYGQVGQNVQNLSHHGWPGQDLDIVGRFKKSTAKCYQLGTQNFKLNHEMKII